MPHHAEAPISAEMRHCIDLCLACYATSEATKAHCVELGGKHVEPAHLRRMADCARLCLTAADFMLRGSDLHGRICDLSAEACRICADDCERVDPSDPMMQECAVACRRCAEACEKMAIA